MFEAGPEFTQCIINEHQGLLGGQRGSRVRPRPRLIRYTAADGIPWHVDDPAFGPLIALLEAVTPPEAPWCWSLSLAKIARCCCEQVTLRFGSRCDICGAPVLKPLLTRLQSYISLLLHIYSYIHVT